MAEPKFDPYAILHSLDRHRVSYIMIGAFARVIQGADEVTRGLDIVPSMREQNLPRLEAALQELGARRADGKGLPVGGLAGWNSNQADVRPRATVELDRVGRLRWDGRRRRVPPQGATARADSAQAQVRTN